MELVLEIAQLHRRAIFEQRVLQPGFVEQQSIQRAAARRFAVFAYQFVVLTLEHAEDSAFCSSLICRYPRTARSPMVALASKVSACSSISTPISAGLSRLPLPTSRGRHSPTLVSPP